LPQERQGTIRQNDAIRPSFISVESHLKVVISVDVAYMIYLLLNSFQLLSLIVEVVVFRVGRIRF
jgi:hypothetical protein